MWQIVSTGTAPLAATQTTLGTVELATQTEVNNGTNTGTTWPVVVQPSELKVVTDMLKTSMFGYASDWDVTISWTVTLTRDMMYNNLTIPAGQTLNPNGYRIFVAWTISGTGTIQRNGNAGWAWAFVTAGAAATTLNQGSLNAEVSAGAGGWSVVWVAGTAATLSLSNASSAAGWAGGNGISGSGTAGGAWAASTRGPAYNRVNPSLPALLYAPLAQTVLVYTGKSSAGGGGSAYWNNNRSAPGGWGGWGNGWVIFISAYIWDFTGTISAVWGVWGAGGNWAGSYGGSWGWGGWGWGTVVRIYHTIPNDCTITLTGGAGWAGWADGGTGGGVAGGNGPTGETISIVF